MRFGYALSKLALQLRLRAVVMIFFGLCLILLWVVDVNSCASFQFSTLVSRQCRYTQTSAVSTVKSIET